jgi:Trypsin
VTFEPVLDVTRNLRSGTVHTDPAYGLDAGFLHDLGVVTLDAPVNGIKPAQLPAAGLVDGIDKKATYTVVGFGVTAPNAPADGVRRFVTRSRRDCRATSCGSPRTRRRPDTAAFCYGDSGGPTFLGATIVALTRNGNKSCTGNAYQYRLDTPSAQGFLAQFVPLP